jgi:DNA-directed RNA polymerase subunit RPC12/RpoP
MGCFDEVYIRCPHCDDGFHWQSKAHDCLLSNYSLDNAPLAILGDLLDSEIWCEHCGKRIFFNVKTKLVVTPRKEE